MPERMVRNASAHHLAVSFSHAALVLAQMPFTHSVHLRPALGWGAWKERVSTGRRFSTGADTSLTLLSCRI
jgi:hypothetical protein